MNKVFLGAVLSAVIATPAFAQDETDTSMARDGFRIEARAMYETPTVSSIVEDDDVFKLGSAVAFGGEVGFDVAVGNALVVGPYANYELSNVESCDGTFCVAAKNNFAAGLHIGYALTESGQLYGKVGYSRLKLETTGPDSTDNGSGAGFAVGYEQGFGENFYGRVEFGYADNGEIYGINFQRRHAGIAIGTRF